MYLGLGVDASQIHARYPTDATQVLDQILGNYVYGAFTLYGKTFQSISTSLKRIFNQDLSHHIFNWFSQKNSVCPVPFSLDVTHGIAIAFFSSAY
jgi:hypothetical protein